MKTKQLAKRISALLDSINEENELDTREAIYLLHASRVAMGQQDKSPDKTHAVSNLRRIFTLAILTQYDPKVRKVFSLSSITEHDYIEHDFVKEEKTIRLLNTIATSAREAINILQS